VQIPILAVLIFWRLSRSS